MSEKLIYVLGDEKATFLNQHPDFNIYVNENKSLMNDNSEDAYVQSQGWGHWCLQKRPNDLNEVIDALNSQFREDYLIVVYTPNEYDPFTYFDLALDQDIEDLKDYFSL